MASITTWTRLEPRARTERMEEALQARVWDPLWLIARQWQVGELRADDVGTPAMARIEADCSRLSRYLPGEIRRDATDRARARDYDSRARPLEALVEREGIHEALAAPDRGYDQPGTNLRVAAEAGLHFVRLLSDNGVGQYAAGYLREFPLRSALPAEIAQLDTATRAWLSVVAERVTDGARLHASFASAYDAATGKMSALPARPAVEAAHAPAVLRSAEAWMKWHAQLFDEPAPGEQPPWNPERMEYQFAVAAPPLPAGTGEVALAAAEYAEGRLDWHAFDLHSGGVLGAVAAPGTNPAIVLSAALASPIQYPGMPSRGWFEMEDGRMNFGAVAAAPEDLARILVTDFALGFSDGWFLVPFELELGAVCRIRTFTVTDTFGVTQTIHHYADNDSERSGWSLFAAAPANGTATVEQRKILLLAPTMTDVVESRPVEDVLLLRDEMANMAWGVEQVVEGAAGRPFDRAQLAEEHRRATRETESASEALAPLVYRLMQDVPEYWIPLVPQRVTLPSGRASLRLRRGRMLHVDGEPPRPRGRILQPDTALSLFDETVPRAGARVTRTYQLARWTNGSTYLWSGRRSTAGRGEGSSGLRFDRVSPVVT